MWDDSVYKLGKLHSMWGDWVYELITRGEWCNQNTRNAISGVLHVIKHNKLIMACPAETCLFKESFLVNMK